MTIERVELPRWVDRGTLTGVWSGGAVDCFEAAVAVGRLLRSRQARVTTRRALVAAMTARWQADGLVALEDAAWGTAETLGDAWEGLATAVMTADVLAVVALRDDLESLRRVLAAVRFQQGAGEDLGASLDLLRAELDDRLGAVDARAEADYAALRDRVQRAMQTAGPPPPAELLAMVSSGENPWWLDLVDPAFRVVERSPPSGVLRAVAATRTVNEMSLLRVLRFEQGLLVRFADDHMGRLNARLQGTPPAGGEPLELVWLAGDDEQVAVFHEEIPGYWLCHPNREVLEADVVAVRRAGVARFSMGVAR